MTQPSRYSSMGFTLGLYAPLPLGGGFLRDLRVGAQDWEHTISLFGGFDTALLTLADDQAGLEEWLEEGLGRGVTAYDDAGVVMWDGFVNRVTLRLAGLEIRRGPLTEIVNRVHAVYSTIDTSTTPPTPGIRASTAQAQDLDSQARYGVWPQVLSLAGVTPDNAEQLRDTYMAEHARPATSSNYSPADQTPEAEIELRGWAHSLAYPYNQTGVSGEIDLDGKLRMILDAQPNGWVSDDYGQIAANTLQVGAWENDDVTALALLKGLTAMGDADAARYGFGVYEGRRAVYAPIGETAEYAIQLSDPARTIYDQAGAEIYPWRVRPGKWARFVDFMPGLAAGAELRADPRALLIEEVTFRLPWGVQLVGGSADSLGQKLARLGLAGTSH